MRANTWRRTPWASQHSSLGDRLGDQVGAEEYPPVGWHGEADSMGRFIPAYSRGDTTVHVSICRKPSI